MSNAACVGTSELALQRQLSIATIILGLESRDIWHRHRALAALVTQEYTTHGCIPRYGLPDSRGAPPKLKELPSVTAFAIAAYGQATLDETSGANNRTWEASKP